MTPIEISLLSVAISAIAIVVTVTNSFLQDRRRFAFEKEKVRLDDELKKAADVSRRQLALVQEQIAILSRALR